jgi:hypothetical protein
LQIKIEMADLPVFPYLIAFVGGIASHVLYFNRGEHHFYGFLYLYTFLIACAGGVVTLSKVHGFSGPEAILSTSLAGLSYLVGVFGSTLVYRLFVSPLNRFPGPWPAKISNFYMSSKLGNSDAFYQLQALHEKYGPIVRIGSNDLSIINADLVEPAYGKDSKVTKSPWYDGDAPLTSMHTSRDKALHDKRRRVWAPAFSERVW